MDRARSPSSSKKYEPIRAGHGRIVEHLQVGRRDRTVQILRRASAPLGEEIQLDAVAERLMRDDAGDTRVANCVVLARTRYARLQQADRHLRRLAQLSSPISAISKPATPPCCAKLKRASWPLRRQATPAGSCAGGAARAGGHAQCRLSRSRGRYSSPAPGRCAGRARRRDAEPRARGPFLCERYSRGIAAHRHGKRFRLTHGLASSGLPR